MFGQFVDYRGWRIWVENDWCDKELEDKAKQIYDSGWLQKNKL